MMGASDVFKSALGDLPEGDITSNLLAAKALIREGLAVIIIAPGGKKPLCVLSSAQAKTADNKVQKEAREAGSRNWAKVTHPCGRAHIMTKLTDLNRPTVREHLESGANLAVVLGEGTARMVVADLDTQEERRGFLAEWSAEAGQDVTLDSTPMTVTSPGKMNTTVNVGGQTEEVWVHKNGGHYWFTLPEGFEVPEHVSKLIGDTGWTIYVRDCYILVPPSVRPEGPYRLTGSVHEAPQWLMDRLEAVEVPQSSERLLERFTEDGDEIADWSARTTWEELLAPRGWGPTAASDSCGCPIWTRPGAPAHLKSATAHEDGCVRYNTPNGYAPIHSWSDAVRWGGKDTVTKLNFLAWTDFNGQVGAAMRSVGISPVHGDLPELEELEEFSLDGSDPWEEEGSADPKDDEAVIDTWAPVDLTEILAGTYVPLAPTLFPRTDVDPDTGLARCLLYPGLMHSFHGESESGKSLILMGEAARLMTAGQDVLWITFDSDAVEDVGRARRMGCSVEDIAAHLTYLKPDQPPSAMPESYRALFKNTYALCVIDGVTDAVALITGDAKGDVNDVYTLFSRRFPRRLASRTGAAVVLVDHVTKDADTRGRFAIGGQSKMASLDGAAYLVEPGESAPTAGGVGEVILRVGKDRPGGVRSHAGERRVRDRTQEAARIVVDDTGEYTVMTVHPPEIQDPYDVSAEVRERRPEDVMRLISETLQAQAPNGLTGESVRIAVGKGAGNVRLALELLENEGFIQIIPKGKAKIHTFVKPYSTLPMVTEMDEDGPHGVV